MAYQRCAAAFSFICHGLCRLAAFIEPSAARSWFDSAASDETYPRLQRAPFLARIFYILLLSATLASAVALVGGVPGETTSLAQSAVPYASPSVAPSNVPYGGGLVPSIPGPPSRPQPVRRPVAWPSDPGHRLDVNDVTPPTHVDVGSAPAGRRLFSPPPFKRSIAGQHATPASPPPQTTEPNSGAAYLGSAQIPVSPPYANAIPSPQVVDVGPRYASPPNSPQSPNGYQEFVQGAAPAPSGSVGTAPAGANAVDGPLSNRLPPIGSDNASLGPRYAAPPQQVATASPTAAFPANTADQARLSIEGSRLPILPEMKPVEGATIIARVGKSVVLERELLRFVNTVLEANADRIPKEQIPQVRLDLMRRALPSLLETKMVVEDVKSKLPQENLDSLQERLAEEFEKNEMKRIMEKMEVKTRREFEAKLAAAGSSIEREKQGFIERTIAKTWIRQNLEIDEVVSHEEMLERYQSQIEEFKYPAEARWQELLIRHDRYGSKAEAHRVIAELGNRVMSGVPFEQVARESSHGATAREGGYWDWTSRGSLVSEVLDNAIFQLPVGSLSQVLEDNEGFHIVRVLERHDAGVVPFVEAQVELREQIREERFEAESKKYLEELKERIPVWTIFDDENGDPFTAQPVDRTAAASSP